jgi:hypothetical protein
MNILLNAAENAMVALLTPVVAGRGAVLPGKSFQSKTLPCVICAADGGSVEEEPKNSGNYWINLDVLVKSSAVSNEDGTAMTPVDPTSFDEQLMSDVFSTIQVSGFAGTLSAATTAFTVFPEGVIYESMQSGRDEHGVWIDSQRLRLYCCASAIAA